MIELTKHLVSAVREKQPFGPYRLGGFCQDGIFAFEVARQLNAAGEDIGMLALFEPSIPSRSARAGLESTLRRMGIRIRVRYAELHNAGIGGFPLYARTRLKNLKWVLIETLSQIAGKCQIWNWKSGPHDMERILFLARNSYKPSPLSCPTVIFRSKDWRILSAGDPYFGWRELLTGPCDSNEVPGDHVGMFHEPNVQVLAERLKVYLEKAGNHGERKKKLSAHSG